MGSTLRDGPVEGEERSQRVALLDSALPEQDEAVVQAQVAVPDQS